MKTKLLLAAALAAISLGTSAAQADTTTESQCIHCNRCMPTIYTGTRCPLVPDPLSS